MLAKNNTKSRLILGNKIETSVAKSNYGWILIPKHVLRDNPWSVER